MAIQKVWQLKDSENRNQVDNLLCGAKLRSLRPATDFRILWNVSILHRMSIGTKTRPIPAEVPSVRKRFQEPQNALDVLLGNVPPELD